MTNSLTTIWESLGLVIQIGFAVFLITQLVAPKLPNKDYVSFNRWESTDGTVTSSTTWTFNPIQAAGTLMAATWFFAPALLVYVVVNAIIQGPLWSPAALIIIGGYIAVARTWEGHRTRAAAGLSRDYRTA